MKQILIISLLFTIVSSNCIPKPQHIKWHTLEKNNNFKIIKLAFRKWQLYTGINFIYDNINPSIIVSFEDIYHKNNKNDKDFINDIAHIIYYNNISYIHLPKNDVRNYNILYLLMHEIGHALKLKDTFMLSEMSIMNSFYNDKIFARIYPIDIAQFNSIYCNPYNTNTNINDESILIKLTIKNNEIQNYNLDIIPKDP